MTRDTEVQELLDHRALLELKYRYCWCIDAEDTEGFADVFTNDAVLSARRLGEDDPHLLVEGRDELRTLVDKRHENLSYSLSQHRPYNPIITVNNDEARGKWYMTAVTKSDDTIELEFGEYHEQYCRVNGEWKIAHCAVEYTEITPVLDE